MEMNNPPPTRTVFRIGDTAKVVKPLVFIRCGYPCTLEEETRIVTEEFGSKITEMFRDCGGPVWTEGREFKRVASEIAYARLRSRGFGGRERKIYTKENSSIDGKEFTVVRKKVVKTGRYYSPSGYGEDWEPGGLCDCKTHVIVSLADPSSIIRRDDGAVIIHQFPTGNEFWIESTNIVKVEKDGK